MDYDMKELAKIAKALADRIEALEARRAADAKVIEAAREMYETSMLTAGGSPEAWRNYVMARNAYAALAEQEKEDE